ncbi:MAG: mechanosensitive ion channel family protein [Chloroflexota bacterium]
MNVDFSQAIKQLQEMINSVIAFIPNMVIALIILIVFVFISRAVRGLVIRVLNRSRKQRNLGLVLGRLSQWVTVLLGFLVAAVIIFPTFSPADLVGFLGASGVAIGFAFRDILQNFLAGILLLLTEPFRVDDQIIFGNYEGTVEEIETRATIIRTYDGRRVVIPNGELFTHSVIVNTAFENRRVEYDVGIGYSDDISTAKRLILEALGSITEVLSDPSPDVIVMELGDFNVILRVRWWIGPPRRRDALDTRDQVLHRIKDILTANGIDLPFPTTQILLHDQSEDTDGDRRRQREGWPAGQGDVPSTRVSKSE